MIAVLTVKTEALIFDTSKMDEWNSEVEASVKGAAKVTP